MEEYDAQIRETTPYPSTESIPELVLLESDSTTEQQSRKKTVRPTPPTTGYQDKRTSQVVIYSPTLWTPGSSRKRNLPKFMSDNPQRDSGTSEEIIYIEDDEEFTPVQMMKKQADKMMMPSPQDTTQ